MKITKVYVKRLSGRQRLLGVASVVFDDCFKVRDILILPRNENERYISMPSKKLKDNRWLSLAHPITQEFNQEIERCVLDEYNRLGKAGLDASESRESMVSDPEDE
jgi:DNA-binding cell septation regulator SpoVG